MIHGGSIECSVFIIDHNGDPGYPNSQMTIIEFGNNVWRQGQFNEFVFGPSSNFTEYEEVFPFPTYQEIQMCTKMGKRVGDNCKINNEYVPAAPWPFQPTFSFQPVRDPSQLVNALRNDLKRKDIGPDLKRAYQATIDAIERPNIWYYKQVGLFFGPQ